MKSFAKINTKEDIDQLLQFFDKNVIASKTNLKGIITYASKAYQKISGYSEDELIGSPHNIVRDPSMPKEVFENMWNTIKSNNIWEGEVRNRKKDGTFYWLKAIISPFYEKGVLVGYSAIREDITAKKELENLNKNLELKVEQRTVEIENQFYYDSLTDLGSYQALNVDVQKSDFMFTTLILINIDNFQNINSLYGFDVGNDVLKEFADCLNSFNTNGTYKIYRIYADEFVLFSNSEFKSIETYYDDLMTLKHTVDNYKFYIKPLDERINIDVTMGVSLGQENPITTVDMALRYAKKHRVWFKAYNSNINLKDKLKQTLFWKDKIKSALLEDRIIPVFQPILNRKQETIKYEVLLRMRDDDGSLISPYKFLEEAINSKQYNNIAKVIFQKTFELMKTTNKLFSINISYDDIYNNDLISFIEEIILKSPDVAKQLVIEILETSAIEDDTIMKEFTNKFRQYGVKIAIDDFGTGHSNLSHILNIDPDYLKIDGAFIKNINEDKQSFAMVKSIVAFCKELDIQVIAEFVHSAEVFKTLYDLDIDEFQGFYFSEPKEEI